MYPSESAAYAEEKERLTGLTDGSLHPKNLQAELYEKMKFDTTSMLNCIMSHNDTVAIFAEKLFAITDLFCVPLLVYTASAYIAACSISDSGKYAAFQTARSDTADSLMVFFIDVFNQQLVWKMPSALHAKHTRHIIIDETKESIVITCDDTKFQYSFDGVLSIDENTYLHSKCVSPYAYLAEAAELLQALSVEYNADIEKRLHIRIQAAKHGNASSYQLSQLLKTLGEYYEQREMPHKALAAYKDGFSLNEKLGVKRKIQALEAASLKNCGGKTP